MRLQYIMREMTRAGWAALLLWSLPAVVGQTAKKPYTAPRLADGHPDLQGVYDLATLTPIERRAGANAVLTKEEAAALETAAAKQRERGDQAIKGDRAAPPKGGDGSVGAAGNVGGYNSGWLDPGSSFTIVDGGSRKALVIESAGLPVQ